MKWRLAVVEWTDPKGALLRTTGPEGHSDQIRG